MASLVDRVPVAPHIALVRIEEDYSDMAVHLADNHCAALDIPADMADRMMCLVVVVWMVDSTDWADMVVVVADSIDWMIDNYYCYLRNQNCLSQTYHHVGVAR